MKRKLVKMEIVVSIPADQSAAFARREVRHLIKGGVGWFFNAGDDDGVKLRSVKGARR